MIFIFYFQDILSNYCVDYKGCLEKSELQKKVSFVHFGFTFTKFQSAFVNYEITWSLSLSLFFLFETALFWVLTIPLFPLLISCNKGYIVHCCLRWIIHRRQRDAVNIKFRWLWYLLLLLIHHYDSHLLRRCIFVWDNITLTT